MLTVKEVIGVPPSGYGDVQGCRNDTIADEGVGGESTRRRSQNFGTDNMISRQMGQMMEAMAYGNIEHDVTH
jgi:hypothetical protein